MEFLLIIIVVVLAISIDKNQREIKNLKNKIKSLVEENNKLKLIIQKLKEGSTVDLNIENNQTIVQPQNIQVQRAQATIVQQVTKQVVKERVEPVKVVNKEQIKNTTILLTGAFLIILAAILLLLTTWNIMPNFIKTVVLFMFVGVFLGISNKAEKMGLKDTSKTFFNLAMAYLPICFVSVSLFGLLGEYLSISGDGRFIYLTAVFLAMAGAYYKFSKTRKSKGLFYSSILSQIFTVVLFSLIFETNISLILLNVALYNILLLIVPERDDMINTVNGVIAYIGLIIGIFAAIFGNTTFILILALIAIFAAFAIIAKRKPSLVNGISLNISILTVILSIVGAKALELDLNLKLCFTMVGVIASIILEENILSDKKYNMVKFTNYILGHIVMFFIYISAVDNEGEIFLQSYMVALVMNILSTVTYLKYKNGFFAVIMPITFSVFASALFQSMDIDWDYHGMVISAIAQFVIYKLFAVVHKDSKKYIEVTINIILGWLMLCAYLAYQSKIANDFGYFLLIFALYGFSEFVAKTKFEEGIYRILAYFSSMFVLFSFFELIFDAPAEIMTYVPLIITIAIIVLENMYKKFDDVLNKIIINIGAVLACMSISSCNGTLHEVLIGITAISTLAYNRYKKQKAILDLPIMIIIWGIILELKLDDLLKALMMLAFASYSIIMSVKEKRINFYSILSYLYLYTFMAYCDNYYINILLIFIDSLIHVRFMKSNKEKDIFKFLSCTTGVMFYINFIDDFVDIGFVSLDVAGWLFLSLYTHNKILNKYIKSSKPLRIITYVIVYMIGTTGAIESLDKMLLMFMELVVIIYSYNERLEAEFISTIGMMILQAFLLTSSFWLAVPWWIYLIVIGGALISFGIRNESKEKGNNVLKEMYNNRFKK